MYLAYSRYHALPNLWLIKAKPGLSLCGYVEKKCSCVGGRLNWVRWVLEKRYLFKSLLNCLPAVWHQQVGSLLWASFSWAMKGTKSILLYRLSSLGLSGTVCLFNPCQISPPYLSTIHTLEFFSKLFLCEAAMFCMKVEGETAYAHQVPSELAWDDVTLVVWMEQNNAEVYAC